MTYIEQDGLAGSGDLHANTILSVPLQDPKDEKTNMTIIEQQTATEKKKEAIAAPSLSNPKFSQSPVHIPDSAFPIDLNRRGWHTIDYLEYSTPTSGNKYLIDFMDSGLLKKLQEPRFSSLHNFKSLKKEITEACGVAAVAARVLKDPRLKLLRDEHVHISTEKAADSIIPISTELETTESSLQNGSLNMPLKSSDILFFDICAGKGINGLLLALVFPECEVVMVDKNPHTKLDHLKTLPNVRFVKQDILHPSFDTLINDTLAATKKKVAILLGIHLCGYLSNHIIDLFNRTPLLSCIVLCPCCLPRKDKSVLMKGRQLKVDDYQYWCTVLHSLIQAEVKDMMIDEEMLSIRNGVVMGMRSR